MVFPPFVGAATMFSSTSSSEFRARAFFPLPLLASLSFFTFALLRTKTPTRSLLFALRSRISAAMAVRGACALALV